MKEKLKNLKVKKKLQQSFKSILIAFIIAVIFAIAGITMIDMNLNRFYRESYQNMQLQLEIRKDVQLVGKNLLWASTATDDSQQTKLDLALTYAQSVNDNIALLSENFSDKALMSSLETSLQTLKAERLTVIEAISAGNQSMAFEIFNTSYTDATEEFQNILLQIGEAADKQAATAYSRASSLVTMIDVILIVVAAVSITLCLKLGSALTSLFLEPITQLQSAAQQLKNGDLNVNIDYDAQDELGDLTKNFQEACTQIRSVIDDMSYLLSEMANNNFNIRTASDEYYIGDFESLLVNIRKMNRQLNNALVKISQASSQVMTGSGQMADNAQSLAEGATEQAGAVQELMATISTVTGIAENSADGASTAAAAAKTSADDANKSRTEINALTEAMERINETSKEIENIIEAIEDIAAQTNLLSLNASIEAARAGEAGRGFAVVADQIGKLAADSAQSAVTTRELIGKSLAEIENGNHIVEKSTETISSILESMEQFAQMASEAAESSNTQSAMLKQIEQGIEQISTVVASNSAAAEETSAISEELSAQAQNLEQMAAAFEFREE